MSATISVRQAVSALGFSGDHALPTPQHIASCQMCGDTGVVTPDVPFGHPMFSKPIPCPQKCDASQARQAKIARAIMQRARIEVASDMTFASFYALEDKAVIGKMHAYGAAQLWTEVDGGFMLCEAAARADHEGWHSPSDRVAISLVLHGKPGRGKTGLASAAINALVRMGKACHFTRADDWFTLMTDRYSGDDARIEANSIIEMMGTIPYLVLDEVSQENPSPAKKDLLDNLLRRRDNCGLPTLMTTNYTKAAFIAAWGQRAGSIAAKAHWVEMAGMELRQTWDVVGEVF